MSDSASRVGRRRFSFLALAAAGWPWAGWSFLDQGSTDPSAMFNGSLTDVRGIKVGHHSLSKRPTGCTVVLCEEGAVGGVDVRGSAPGTRETDLLDPVHTIQQVHAILLSGGSAFGLDAATGVVKYLEEKRIGFDAGVARVPIVPAAILFDLGVGDPKIRPDRDSGYEACKAASSGTVAEGSVGAGAGATVGKMFGSAFAMKGGVGTSAIKLNSGLVVGALMTVNAMGDVVEPATGKLLAGARTPDGKRLINTVDALRRGLPGRSPLEGSNSTIGVVATNAQLTKPQITKVAQMAQDGLARAINPAHTPWDGDTIFALSTGTLTTPASVSAPDFVTTIGTLAAEAVAQAIVRAILRAAGLPGLPSHNDLFSAEPK